MSTPGGPDRDPYGPRTPEDAAYGPVPPAPPAWSVGPPAGSSSAPPTGPYPAPPGGYGAAVPGYGHPAYAPPPPAPPSGGRGPLAAALFAVAAALVVLALAVGAHALAVGVSGAGLGGYEDGVEPGQSYGENDYLDGLWDDCEAGDGFACDELSWSSEYGSDYEQFGSTCGDRLDDDAYAPMTCEDVVD